MADRKPVDLDAARELARQVLASPAPAAALALLEAPPELAATKAIQLAAVVIQETAAEDSGEQTG